MSSQQVKLKPWPKPVYECDGDYRKEAFLEEYIGGPLYKLQKDLPKLPIPSVEETITKFLPTALPLCRNKEEEVDLKIACSEFARDSTSLQQRLIKRKETEMSDTSWLQVWWNQLGYLQVRDPVVVNVSYFFGFVDEPTRARSQKPLNVQRGAKILFSALKYRQRVVSGSLEASRAGKKQTLLCSVGIKYMMHSCRIPQKDQDCYHIYDPRKHTHGLVARKGHFFSIELCDEHGNPLPHEILEDQLAQCIVKADKIPSSRPKLGLLTSENRDVWAQKRTELIRRGGKSMELALTRLQSSCLCLNLDDESPISRKECAELLLTGGLKSGENRWFDKSIQISVCKNGKAGLLAEHAMMDGTTMVDFVNFISKENFDNSSYNSVTLAAGAGGVIDIFAEAMQHMEDWEATNVLVRQATFSFQQVVGNQCLRVQNFENYGSTFIKKVARFPPDAYVQMAMQLATYRTFGEQVGTYESTQVRSFLHGRTEVTRSVSTASEAFIKIMGKEANANESNPSMLAKKLILLTKAVTAHSKSTRMAATAMGVDRHFFGLSMVAGNDRLPKLYNDPVFQRSKKWRSSTSQLSHPFINVWGYGQVVPDGVGLAYSIGASSCVFCITGLSSTGFPETLSHHLSEALMEMKQLAEFRAKTSSKL